MKKLLQMARNARKKAYAPYSHFKVGAALETTSGKIYTGCNVENASHGAAICAERTALVKAVSEGHRRFRRIAIVANTKEPCPPCGICRQVLMEFSPKMEVIMVGVRRKILVRTLCELLPHAFNKDDL